MISWDRVNELRHEVGPDDFEEVVEIFLEEVDEVMARLRASPDPNRFAEDFHFLKGSALNLGFDALGRVCQDSERAVTETGSAAVDLTPLMATYEESCRVFATRSGVT